MQTVATQVLDYLGEGLGSDIGVTSTMMDDWLTEARRYIVGRCPKDKLHHFATLSTLATSAGLTLTSNQYLNVTRNDGTIERPARKIDPWLRGRIEDKDDVLYTDKYDPVHYLMNNKLYIYPTPSASQLGNINVVSSGDLSATASVPIAGWPDDAEKLGVDFVVIQAKTREFGYARRKVQDELESITTSGYLASFDTAVAAISAASFTYSATLITNAIASASEFINDLTRWSIASGLNQAQIVRGDLAAKGAQSEINRAIVAIQSEQAQIAAYGGDVGAFAQNLAKAHSHLEKSAVRLQTMQGYVAQSTMAREEVGLLQAKFDKDLEGYFRGPS